MAQLLLDNNIRIYSQWVAGDQNVIADYLSRDFDKSDEQLTKFLLVGWRLAIMKLPSGLKLTTVATMPRLDVPSRSSDRS